MRGALEQVTKKSIWKERSTGFWAFFCPHCARQRRIALHPNPWRPIQFFRVGITTSLLAVALWPLMSGKGLFLFVPLWIVFEVTYRLKVRGLLPCPHCGFDPYLYQTDVDRARSEMQRFWRTEFDRRGIPWPEEEASVSSETPIPPGAATPGQVDSPPPPPI